GLYGAPRFDIPQARWERLDRCDGKGAIETIGNWADDFGLRIAVETEYPFIRWDNPGDFQLAPLQEILRIGGFDETMLDGPYHIDSNMGRRLSLKYGNV
ncbi:MAG: hypothetical protein AAB214_08480, partial [Fibrobacterota bacterium]